MNENALIAGKIVYAIIHAVDRTPAWTMFALIVKRAREGSPTAVAIRRGIKNIALKLKGIKNYA